MCDILPPANEVWGKIIFLHLSVILFTGGSTWRGTPGQVHPLQVHPPAVHNGIRSASGRYAFYWNAFLLCKSSHSAFISQGLNYSVRNREGMGTSPLAPLSSRWIRYCYCFLKYLFFGVFFEWVILVPSNCEEAEIYNFQKSVLVDDRQIFIKVKNFKLSKQSVLFTVLDPNPFLSIFFRKT